MEKMRILSMRTSSLRVCSAWFEGTSFKFVIFTEGKKNGRLGTWSPLMSSLLVTVWGVVKQFFFVGSKSGQKQSVKLQQNMVYSTIQHPPPPPHRYTVCIYCTFSVGRGGGQKEGRVAAVHKYSSFVHGGNSLQAGSKIPTMSECISSL
jgi:hypothetical protein